jgi:hypothetical protein
MAVLPPLHTGRQEHDLAWRDFARWHRQLDRELDLVWYRQ